MTAPRLYYVADPMCSWCYGFAPVLVQIETALVPGLELRLVMGGLAPDSDEPMPEAMRAYVQGAWDAVEAATAVPFNRDFWERCTPRRSTYPACRAVLAAQGQGHGLEMYRALQEAYYREARNPSDLSTHVELAEELGLDVERFREELGSSGVRRELDEDLALRDRLGVNGFPSLMLIDGGRVRALMRGYEGAQTLLPRLAREGLITLN